MKKHILYIEDDIVDRMCFERIFEDRSSNYTIKIIDSIAELRREEALDVYDVIITDLFLGDGGAKDVMEMLNNRKVVLLSGETDPDYLERMLPDQLLATISKPVTFEELKKALPAFFGETSIPSQSNEKNMATPTMIKMDNLERMSKGNTAYMAELLDLALELLPERMNALNESVGSHNWAQYHQAAHALKSIAKMVGIPIYELLDKMDKGGRQEPAAPEELISMFETLKPQIETAHQEMQQIRDGLN